MRKSRWDEKAAYRNSIDIARVSCEGNDDSDNHTKHVTICPPIDVGVVCLQVRDDGRHKGDKPREDRNREGHQGEWVTQDVAETEFAHFESVTFGNGN